MSFRRLQIDTFALRGLSVALGAGAYLLTARWLGPNELGRFALLIGSVSLTGALFGCGLATAEIYFAAHHPDKRGALAANGLWAALILGVAGGLAFPLLLWLLSGFEWIVPISWVWSFAPVVPLILLFNHYDRMLQGAARIRIVNRLELARMAVWLLAIVILLPGFSWGLSGALAAWTLALAVHAMLSLVFYLRWEPHGLLPDRYLLREMFRFGLRERTGEMLDQVILYADRFFLFWFWGEATVGIYAVAVWIAQKMWFIPNTVGRVAYPLLASGEKLTTGGFPSVVRAIIGSVALLSIVLIFVGEWLIGLLFGTEFTTAYLPLIALLPGVLAITLSKILKSWLFAHGHPETAMWSSVLAFSLNLPLNLMLIPIWGAWGAAAATSAAYLAYGVWIWRGYENHSGERLLSFSKRNATKTRGKGAAP